MPVLGLVLQFNMLSQILTISISGKACIIIGGSTGLSIGDLGYNPGWGRSFRSEEYETL
jgi:hypothetical protein